MKKIYLLMLVLMIATVSAQIEAPGISVTLLNQDPDPVEPGEYVDLRFKIENSQIDTTARSMQVEIVPSYPFTLDPTADPVKNLGDLPALGDANVAVVRYRVRVDEGAVQGENKIRLRFKHSRIDWITKEFDIEVETTDANIAVVSVETTPERIVPGDRANLQLHLRNMADSSLKDVTLTLDLTFSRFLEQASTITASDSIAAFNTLPFAPMGSATEKKIDLLRPGEEHIFSYELLAFADAEPKVYKIPIQITYTDDDGSVVEKEDIIGLVVGTQPDMSVVIEETDLHVGKQRGAVTIKFVNKGFTDIKFLDVTAQKSEDYDLLCCQEIYIGNVDSDDYETAEFEIYLNNAPGEEMTIPFTIQTEYRDANNQIYDETYVLELNILSPEKLGMGNGGSPVMTIIVVLIIGVVVVYWYRKRKKKR